MEKNKKTTDLSKMTREELEKNYIEKEIELNAIKLTKADEIEKLLAKIQELEEQARLLKSQKFGKSSEKSKVIEDENQLKLSIFNEVETIADVAPVAEEIEMVDIAPPVKARKKKSKLDKTIKKLPKETYEYKLSNEEMSCPKCSSGLGYMKKTLRKELCIIPAKVYVKEHITYHYSCRNCQETGEGAPIISAQSPKFLFNSGVASPSLVSYIIKNKYIDHMPIYRQEQDFKNRGLKIPRANISNWIMQGAEKYLSYIYDEMKEDLLREPIIHADETPCEVINEPGKTDGPRNGYMWVYTTAKRRKDITIYEYANTRSGDIPKEFLKGYSGYLQTDGYGGYNKVINIINSKVKRVGCFAHVRRKYSDAIKAMPKEAKEQRNTGAHIGLNYMNKLFSLDEECKLLEINEAAIFKESTIKPLLDEYFNWAKENAPLYIKGLTKDALMYSVNQENILRNYLLDGEIECSNNKAERAIKPFVIGRKNYLFHNTPRGANASAIIYSIAQSAKNNNLDILGYLECIFFTLSQLQVIEKSELQKLLPYSKEMIEKFKLMEEN